MIFSSASRSPAASSWYPSRLLLVTTHLLLQKVNFATNFICCTSNNSNCTSRNIADHIDQIVRHAGVESVGFGCGVLRVCAGTVSNSYVQG